MILQRQPMADLDEKQYTSSNSVEIKQQQKIALP